MRLSWWTVPAVRYPKGMMMTEKFRHCGCLIGKSLRSESLLEVYYLQGYTHSVYTWQQPRKNGLTQKPSETISYCTSYLSCGCHKMPDRTNGRKKRKEGIVLARDLRVEGPVYHDKKVRAVGTWSGWSWDISNQGESDIVFFFLFSSRPQPWKWCYVA